MKTCTKCGLIGELGLFCKNKNLCRECNKSQCKEYKNKNKDKCEEYNKQYRISHSEELKLARIKWNTNNKDKIREYDKRYKDSNRELINISAKEYRENNKEILSEKFKIRYRNNKDVILLKQKEYRNNNREKISNRIKTNNSKNIVQIRLRRNRYLKNLRDTDESYRIGNALRTTLRRSLARNSIKKTFHSGITNKKIQEILEYIGTRPDNTFHLDHIIPLCEFNLEIKRHRELANSKYNLRWIPANENLIKNNNIDYTLICENEELTNIAKEIGIIGNKTND